VKAFGDSAALNGWSPPLHGTEKHIKEKDTMNNDHALHTRRDLIVKAGLLTLSSAVAPSLASATVVPAKEASSKDAPRYEQTRSPITFVLDKNLNLPTDQEPWVGMLKAAGIKAHATTDLVHVDQLLVDNGPDIAYIPGGDFCKLILKGNPHYQGLVIATSKFTGEPYQRTLLVVRKDDPANSIDDLAGSTYGYMNKSCSSSYFPPAVMLNRQGKNFEQFLKIVEVPGWQNRVDAVVAKKIRSTMILDDVWKMTPSNEQTCKIIGEMDDCPPAILAVNKRLDIETVGKLREQALSYIPSWQTVYGAFRSYNYADVQSFTHYLSELPADV
jgi:ABC-type phosphate/phosphonate transport system substrate-binding protein